MLLIFTVTCISMYLSKPDRNIKLHIIKYEHRNVYYIAFSRQSKAILFKEIGNSGCLDNQE